MLPLVQFCFQICEVNNKTCLKIHECISTCEIKSNPYPSLPLLVIWAFFHNLSSLIWKEDRNKLLDLSKWSTLHLCHSPLCHMIHEMPILIFLTMAFFFYTCDPWLCHEILQNIIKGWEHLFMHEASGMWQVIQNSSKYVICTLGNVKGALNGKTHKDLWPSALNVICFHLWNFSSFWCSNWHPSCARVTICHFGSTQDCWHCHLINKSSHFGLLLESWGYLKAHIYGVFHVTRSLSLKPIFTLDGSTSWWSLSYWPQLLYSLLL